MTKTPRLDRRNFMLTAASTGALIPLGQACVPVAADLEPVGAPGEFGNPFTAQDPGPHVAIAAAHQPTLFAGMVDDTNVRLWVEVLDAVGNVAHPQDANHFTKQIVIKDDFQNDIAARGFRYDSQARLITTVTVEAPVRSIYVWHECSVTGWWRAQYFLDEQVILPPAGDTRRAYTLNNPKDGANAIEEVPLLGRLPTGELAVEVGDRSAGSLHPMTPEHYIQTILVYDQFDQLREAQNLGPNFPEPAITINEIGGDRARVVAFCNTHQWWEGEFSII